jgi:hypothetical protein
METEALIVAVVAVIAALLTAWSGTVASPGVSPTPDGQTPAASASVDPFSCPEGLAVDASVALYIAHFCTNRVLVVSRAGAQSIFAGTGSQGTPEMADRRPRRSSGA